MTNAILSIDVLKEIMDRVESKTIQHNSEELEANPVSNAAAKLYQTLKDAVDLVMEEGQAVIEKGRDMVLGEWVRQRQALGNRSSELLKKFQEQFQLLIGEAMESIVQSLPCQISGNALGKLDVVTYKMALSVAPSISFAATEWLKIVAAGGIEVSVAYKFT